MLIIVRITIYVSCAWHAVWQNFGVVIRLPKTRHIRRFVTGDEEAAAWATVMLPVLVASVPPSFASEPVTCKRHQRGSTEVLLGSTEVLHLRGSTEVLLTSSMPRILLDDTLNMPRELCFEPVNVNVRCFGPLLTL